MLDNKSLKQDMQSNNKRNDSLSLFDIALSRLESILCDFTAEQVLTSLCLDIPGEPIS